MASEFTTSEGRRDPVHPRVSPMWDLSDSVLDDMNDMLLEEGGEGEPIRGSGMAQAMNLLENAHERFVAAALLVNAKLRCEKARKIHTGS